MLIVFDWDGTLVDSSEHIVRAMQSAAEKCQLPVLSAETIKKIIGLGLPEALALLYPKLSAEGNVQLQKAYRVSFFERDEESKLFPGVRQYLGELKRQGHVLAVATGKGRAGLDRQMQKFNLSSCFDYSRCADETASKPDPRMLNEIIEASGFCTREVLMIGDTTYDLDMACNAGVRSVGVSYGVHAKAELVLCKPLQVVDSIEKILHWV